MKFIMLSIWTLTGTAAVTAQSPRGTVTVPPRPAFADSLPSAAHAPIRYTVVDAEAEGALWPHRSEPTFQPPYGGAADFAANAARKCVHIGTNTARSGEFLIGGDLGAVTGLRELKIWWEPMHPAQTFSLVVRGASLTQPADTLRYFNTGWAIGGSAQAGTTGPIFYASGFTFPATGRWLLIATSGPDWGCFLF